MKKRWVASYEGHEIEVENALFSERLWIDGILACKHITLGGHRELSAAIGPGEGAAVKSLISGIFRLRCSIWINNLPADLAEMRATLADLVAFFLLMFGGAGLYRQLAHGYTPVPLAIACASLVLAVVIDSWPRRKSHNLRASRVE